MDLLEVRFRDSQHQRHAGITGVRICAHKFEMTSAGCTCVLCGVVQAGVLDDQHASYQQQQLAYETLRNGRRRRTITHNNWRTLFLDGCNKLKLNLHVDIIREGRKTFEVLLRDVSLKPLGMSCFSMCTGKNSIAMIAVVIILTCRIGNIKIDEHTIVHYTLKKHGIRPKLVSRCFIVCKTWKHFNR